MQERTADVSVIGEVDGELNDLPCRIFFARYLTRQLDKGLSGLFDIRLTPCYHKVTTYCLPVTLAPVLPSRKTSCRVTGAK